MSLSKWNHSAILDEQGISIKTNSCIVISNINGIIDTHEEREVSIVDIPNAFIQNDNPKEVVDQIDIYENQM